MPFLANIPADAFLPIKKSGNIYSVVREDEIASFGSGSSAAFTNIFTATSENATQYFDRVNTRNKLDSQHFINSHNEMCLVMVGAGGGYTCAAYVPMSDLKLAKTIIDQTLYWYIAKNEDEALYICGLLNSRALDEIIADFQPVGEFGRRHVHTLPYAVTPPYDETNPAHLTVVDKTRTLVERIKIALEDAPDVAKYFVPSQSTLAVRRRKIREFIATLPESTEYEDACKNVYL